MLKKFEKLGFGIGIDLPWGSERGFDFATNGPSKPLADFLTKQSSNWNHFFFAFQPRSRNPLSIADYLVPWQKIYDLLPSDIHRGFHHTILNLGYGGSYPRAEIIDFTNEVIDRFAIEWVVEDLGIWSIAGKALPYPLPPIMTSRGLSASIKNIDFCCKRLSAPLCVEFPGFTDGSSLIFGTIDAFDFFRIIVQETGCLVTLDAGHILGYWYETRGNFDGMYDHLNRLPLSQCFEIHLSGAQLRRGRFIDSHHGILMKEQVDLAAWLIQHCPNLRAITYEDPIWDRDAEIAVQAKPMVNRLRGLITNE
jgi:uncharacterized protein (UPF0276 family)